MIRQEAAGQNLVHQDMTFDGQLLEDPEKVSLAVGPENTDERLKEESSVQIISRHSNVSAICSRDGGRLETSDGAASDNALYPVGMLDQPQTPPKGTARTTEMLI